jgi:hypothetical protein
VGFDCIVIVFTFREKIINFLKYAKQKDFKDIVEVKFFLKKVLSRINKCQYKFEEAAS